MLNKILYICKWIGGVIGGITAIAGIILFIYSQGIKSEQEKIKDYSLEAKVDRLIEYDSIKTIKLDQVLINQDEFSQKQIMFEKKMDNLNNSYINHLKTDKKIDELINYLEGVKKNNENILYPIVFKNQELKLR